jgi:hypothetical protein
MKHILFLSFLPFFLFSFCFAKSGEIGYSSVLQDRKPWFEVKSIHSEKSSYITYTSGNGELLAEEKLNYQDGKVINYEWQQHQIKENIKLSNSDKLIKNYTEKAPLVFPPLLTQFLQNQIKENPNKKSFALSVVAPDKGLILNFHFILKDKTKNEMKWELKADSFFVRLLFSDLFFILNHDLQILRIENIELPIKYKVKNHFESRKTDIIFNR